MRLTPEGGEPFVLIDVFKGGWGKTRDISAACQARGRAAHGRIDVFLGGKPRKPTGTARFTFRRQGKTTAGRVTGVKVVQPRKGDKAGAPSLEGEAGTLLHYSYHSISCDDLIRSKAAQWSWATRTQ